MTSRFDRERWRTLADALAAAVVAAVPWSTSIAYILIAAWLVVFLPLSDREEWQATIKHPAAWLPVSLVALAAVGMIWAGVPWSERLSGFGSFAKLLVIPVLFVQFRHSQRARWIFVAFLASCTALLILSWVMVVTGIRVRLGGATSYGVPVRDYIVQSQEFILCAVGLVYVVFMRVRERRWDHAAALAALALLFLINSIYIAPSRTGFVTVPVLLAILVAAHCRLAYSLATAGAIIAMTTTAWMTSPKIQDRILGIMTEIEDYRVKQLSTSAGERVAFWTTSLDLVKQAPIIGHGTGSIRDVFARAAVESGSSKRPTTNPHNQTFTIAIQLGLAGVALLFAMWLSHLLLFRGGGLTGWVGLAVVVQNIIGSLFNNHLFDFTQAWIYMFGVGVAGALMLKRERDVPGISASQAAAKT